MWGWKCLGVGDTAQQDASCPAGLNERKHGELPGYIAGLCIHRGESRRALDKGQKQTSTCWLYLSSARQIK